jgi:hypothetical protein
MNDPERQAEYNNIYNQFDKSLVEHIPNIIPTTGTNYTMSSPGYYSRVNEFHDIPNHSKIFVTEIIPRLKKYNRIKDHYSRLAKYVINTSNECAAIIRTYENSKIINNCDSCSIIYPIPEFAIYEYSSDNEEMKNLDDCEIVVLDCKEGNFTNEEAIEPNEEMPLGWKNGYSRGLTFNSRNQTIQYWLIIW